MPSWVEQGYDAYAKRLTQEIQLELIEIATKKRTKNANTEKIQQFEESQLIKAAQKCDFSVALDPKGKSYTTEKFAQTLENWQHRGLHKIGLLVGGPEGLTDGVRRQADHLWSLSALTFPHPLVRVVVAEQIYRAWSLLKSHPYHR